MDWPRVLEGGVGDAQACRGLLVAPAKCHKYFIVIINDLEGKIRHDFFF